MNKVIFKSEARKKLLEGIEIVGAIAGGTMGQQGNYTVIQRPYGSPKITKDGYYSIKNVSLKDQEKQQGVLMVVEAARKTAEEDGDGTTTCTVLATEMVRRANNVIESGSSPRDVKKGIEIAVGLVNAELSRMAIPLNHDNGMIEDVATISANNNRQIGRDIAYAMSKIKSNGIITALESKSLESRVEVVDGMKINRGFISPYFTTNQEKMECVLDNPYILVHDDIISGIKDLVPILEEVTKQGRGMLIVAKDVNGEALATIIQNKVKAHLPLACIQAPGFGASMLDEIEDVAMVTGATVISERTGHTLSTVTLEMLGQAEKVVITRNSTEFIGSKGDKELIEARLLGIKSYIDTVTDVNTKEVLNKRIANIDGGVAVLYVGGATEMEVSEKLDLVEDAIAATKSAIAKGVVPGGGSSLVLASKVLEKFTHPNRDVFIGVDIVRNSLHAPLKQIMTNAGLSGDVILEKVSKSEIKNAGYNLITGEVCDMVESGILDTAKVEISAVSNASSVASLFIMTHTLQTIIEEEQK